MHISDRLSIIVPTPKDTASLIALIVYIDAAFDNNQSRYEVIVIASPEYHLNLDELTPYQQTFPVTITQDQPLLQQATYETIAVIRDTSHATIDALPYIWRQRRHHHKPAIIGVARTSPARLLWNTIKTSFLGFTNKYSHQQLTQSKIVLTSKTILRELYSSDIVAITSADLITHLIKRHIAITYCAIPDNLPILSGHQRRFNSLLTMLQKRLHPNHYIEFSDEQTAGKGRGFYYKGAEYVTHNTLTRSHTAVERTTLPQRFVLLGVLVLVTLLALFSNHLLVVFLVSCITVIYFCDLLFNMFLIYRSFKSYSEINISDQAASRRRSWPRYTILCPLYKETAVIPQFIAAMEAIDYPATKREVLLLLEQDDNESIAAIQDRRLPAYFTVVIVPHSLPKTKPKACNYGLLQATGQYAVIYDAEDIPDPLQLKKAVIAFETSSPLIGCIQAKLNYYNWDQNLLTRLFTLEYSLWFNLILTGLQSIKAPIPLGGTSNHFRTKDLKDLGGWDPFNVTEDADLGIRLAKRGMKTAVLDSTTLEEANSEIGNWLKQRSRWIKGYMQTYLVHMRDLREFSKHSSRLDMITFQLVIGGKVMSMLINPLLWVMTLSYFIFRPEIGHTIESLYLTPIFYIGALSLIVGNFMYLYYYMMGAARQNRPELIIYALFVPLYWVMMSMAAYYALRDLIIRPFHWQKTRHGLHLKHAPGAPS